MLSNSFAPTCIPRDQVDSSAGGAGREELEGEPAVPRLYPPPHLVPEPVGSVGIQHRRGRPGALPRALPAVARSTRVTPAAHVPAGVRALVHHDY